MIKKKILVLAGALTLMAAIPWGVDRANAQSGKKNPPQLRSTTSAQRKAAAIRRAAAQAGATLMAAAVPGGMPDYFGTTPNWAFTALPANDPNATTLNVSVSGGGGTGAAGLAAVFNGAVIGIAVSTAGTGYFATPTVTIDPPTGTPPMTALAKAVVDPTNGVITAVVVTNPGSGYLAVPNVTIVGPGNTGSGATAIAILDLVSGTIPAVAVTNGGSGYQGPTVLIDPGLSGGSGATATATVDPVTTGITGFTVTNPGSGYWLLRNSNGTLTGAIRKFYDSLPGLGAANANTNGLYIPMATPAVQTTYPNDDYYQINLVQYTHQFSRDLPATTVRGYADANATGGDAGGHYMGPVILAPRNKAVRLLFQNLLTPGGPHFLPVDTTVMGAGMDPNGAMYSPNRATLHLHGGDTPWISDGTPHQWTVPVGETTGTLKGVSARDVPDMPATGQGQLTFFWPNQVSNRFMFYHDHAYGITRLNVYAGEAAGYLIWDPVEDGLITQGVIPDNGGGVYRYGIPLVIQDKSFVDANKIVSQDPTWNWGSTPGTPVTGDLWFPHVYMPNQNPSDPMGANANGRWDYGPWFWPPYAGIINGEVPNPLAGTGTENPTNPGTPNPSIVPEGFMDSTMVNGQLYPYLEVGQKAYRFRILNACNDRMLNLQIYFAKSNGTMWDPGTGALLDPNAGEVPMVPAIPGTGLPQTWPTDGRDGGVPAPSAVGPSFIQIGSEGGFLAAPAVLPNTPVGYEYNRRNIVVLNVANKTLFLGPAERADVIVDFSGIPDGTKLILYNDAPAPVPAFDPRNDYYTGCPDQTSSGGAPPTQPGYGPNTRTILQFRVNANLGSAGAYNLAALQTALPAAFAQTQNVPIVPQAEYNAAFGANFPTNNHLNLQNDALTFTPAGQNAPVTLTLQNKAIQELFEVNYGRMNATLGVELPFTNQSIQTTIPYGYLDPATELVMASDPAAPIGSLADGTQIFKITHNGVDTHLVHVHLFNAQLINRVGWDGMIRPPDANEIGWKESIRMHPLEIAYIALRPVVPALPFKLPNSIRLMDPTMIAGSTGPYPGAYTGFDPNNNPVTITNQMINFGWEYVWHCHLLGHEENDFMRPFMIGNPPETPTALKAVLSGNKLTLTWTDNSITATNFTLSRASDPLFTQNLVTFDVAKVAGPTQTYVDTTYAKKGVPYYYMVRGYFVMGGVEPGFPSMNVASEASKTVGPPSGTATLVSVTQAGPKNAPIVVTWTYSPSGDQTGFTIQRALDSGFATGVTNFQAGANATSFSDTNHKTGVTYYYRVQATNALGAGAWSGFLSILAH